MKFTKRTIVLLGLLLTLGAVSAFVPRAQGRVGMPAPDIVSQTWLNSEPTPMAELKGKVVLVEFWTFGCYNCRNVEPYVKDWHKKYAGQGLVVIGVHSPEFNYEKDIQNVKRYLGDHDIRYAVAIDNDFVTWDRYGNRYWPAMYLIDKQGIIRYTRFGEGGYFQTERQIEALLAER
jgi:thiol-disulfide isomerase/thioredoxin